MKRKNKREMVLDIYDREGMGEVTAREIAIINQALIAEFGEGGAMEPGELARILVAEQIPVQFAQVFRMATRQERYENLFANLPRLHTLAQAAESIHEIARLWERFAQRNDATGMRFAREAAQQGKAEALRAANDERNDLQRRAELAEIGLWLTVWLQNPSLFAQWLELRQATAAYRSQFDA